MKSRGTYIHCSMKETLDNGSLRPCNSLVCAIFRGEVGVAVGTVSAPFYWPSEVRGFLVFIGSMDPRRAEGVRLARSVVEWAKTMGATSLRFGSQTDCSLAVLARRLGAKEERPAYLLEI